MGKKSNKGSSNSFEDNQNSLHTHDKQQHESNSGISYPQISNSNSNPDPLPSGVNSEPSKRKRRIVVGFKNFGNTCYMNSALQSIYHAPVNWQQQNHFDETFLSLSSTGGISNMFRTLERNLSRGRNINMQYDPVLFLEEDIINRMGPTNQSFLQFMITETQKQNGKIVHTNTYPKNYIQYKLPAKGWFGNKKPDMHEEISKLAFKTEGGYSKEYSKVPPVAIIQVEYDGYNNSSENPEMPMYLDLNCLLDKPTSSDFHELTGIVYHSGSLTGGHYNCIIKSNGSWWRCDDNQVYMKYESVSDLPRDSGGKIRMLVYVRKQDSEKLSEIISSFHREEEKEITEIIEKKRRRIETFESDIEKEVRKAKRTSDEEVKTIQSQLDSAILIVNQKNQENTKLQDTIRQKDEAIKSLRDTLDIKKSILKEITESDKTRLQSKWNQIRLPSESPSVHNASDALSTFKFNDDQSNAHSHGGNQQVDAVPASGVTMSQINDGVHSQLGASHSQPQSQINGGEAQHMECTPQSREDSTLQSRVDGTPQIKVDGTPQSKVDGAGKHQREGGAHETSNENFGSSSTRQELHQVTSPKKFEKLSAYDRESFKNFLGYFQNVDFKKKEWIYPVGFKHPNLATISCINIDNRMISFEKTERGTLSSMMHILNANQQATLLISKLMKETANALSYLEDFKPPIRSSLESNNIFITDDWSASICWTPTNDSPAECLRKFIVVFKSNINRCQSKENFNDKIFVELEKCQNFKQVSSLLTLIDEGLCLPQLDKGYYESARSVINNKFYSIKDVIKVRLLDYDMSKISQFKSSDLFLAWFYPQSGNEKQEFVKGDFVGNYNKKRRFILHDNQQNAKGADAILCWVYLGKLETYIEDVDYLGQEPSYSNSIIIRNGEDRVVLLKDNSQVLPLWNIEFN